MSHISNFLVFKALSVERVNSETECEESRPPHSELIGPSEQWSLVAKKSLGSTHRLPRLCRLGAERGFTSSSV